MSRRRILPLVFFFVLTGAVSPAHAAITYTCDPNIDTRQPGLCATLNTTTAALYSSTFTNADAVLYIRFGKTGLGSSAQFLNYTTYARYSAALSARAAATGNSLHKAASASLATYAAPLYSAGNVEVTAALGRAFGLPGMTGATKTLTACTQGSSGCYDGIITITNDAATPLYFRSGTQPRDSYDFFSIVQHETNELLGISSCIDTGGTTLSNTCQSGAPGVIDLFRYSGPGRLIPVSALSTAPGAYFSYDGGVTNGAGGALFSTLSDGSDYHDFVSNCPTVQRIQDAQGCPGRDGGLDITNDGGSAISMLTAVGYIRVAAVSALPVISPAGVVALGTKSTTIAPGSWVNIYGTNLSSTTRFWNADTEIVNGNLPTALDGVSVKINGQPAYVYYVSPGQINIQAPDDSASGSVPVVVTTPAGTGIATTATLSPVGPALFTFDGKHAAGVIPNSAGFYLPRTPSSYDLLGKTGTFSFFTRPVRRGEVLELFGTGFGPTSPTVPAGKVYSGAARTVSSVTIIMGGVSQSVPAYLKGAGVYQINVTIPGNLALGDNIVQALVNGVLTPAGTFITVE